MSKSKGNVVDPLELLKKYPPDLLRAYFAAKINFLQDGVCDEKLLKNFYQEFLVNNLSNLIARVNRMLQLYSRGIIPVFDDSINNQELKDYYQHCFSSQQEFIKLMDSYQLTKAFEQIQKLIEKSNK